MLTKVVKGMETRSSDRERNANAQLPVVLEFLGKRARAILFRKGIGDMEGFLTLKRDELERLVNCGNRTMSEIAKIQEAIGRAFPIGTAQWPALEPYEFRDCLRRHLSHRNRCTLTSSARRPNRKRRKKRTVGVSDEGKTGREPQDGSAGRIEKEPSEEPVRQALTGFPFPLPVIDDVGLADPVSSSLLRKCIPALWQISDQTLDAVWSAADQRLMQDLPLSECEWRRLAGIGIFKKDPLSVALATSVGYIVQSKSQGEMFDVVADWLCGFVQEMTGGRPIPCLTASESSIVSPGEVESIRSYRLDSFAAPIAILDEMHALGVSVWGDLPAVTEKSLLEARGVAWEPLRQIAAIWQMRALAHAATTKLHEGCPVAYGSLSDMMEDFVRTVVDSQRSNRDRRLTEIILRGRLGLLENRTSTLEEISRLVGLTRERVRQRFNWVVDKNLDRLFVFWLVTREELRMAGGVHMVADLATRLATRMAWQDPPDLGRFHAILRLCSTLDVDNQSGTVRDTETECPDCEHMALSLRGALDGAKGEVSLPDASRLAQTACAATLRCKRGHRRPPGFSSGFVRWVVNKMPDVVIQGGFVTRRGTWGGERGSRTQSAESVLKSAGRAMAFREVYRELRRLQPEDEHITERAVHSWLVKNDNAILWGRGTFIHRDFVHPPDSLLAEIAAWLEDRLWSTGVPFVSVAGPYAVFRAQVKSAGIPSEQALYSCLRREEGRTLTYPKYPRVILAGAESLPVWVVLEQFVSDAGGLIPIGEVIAYGEKELYMKHVSQKVAYVPGVLHTGKGLVIHERNLPRAGEEMGQVFGYARAVARVEGHVSVEKIFADRKITCLTTGIENPGVLYAMLQVHATSHVKTPGYPRVLPADGSDDTRGIIDSVARWIADRSRPCSFEELEAHFVEELGYKERTVGVVAAKGENRVVRYSRGSVVHLDALEWDAVKQTGVDDLGREAFRDACAAGRCCAFIGDLIESVQLPELANGVVWTPTLLTQILEHGGNFIVLGSARNAFVETPNAFRIGTVEDLFCEILRTRYDGASAVHQFTSDMRAAGIVLKAVTPSMLGSQSKVCIKGSVIMLRELCSHA